MKIIDWLLNLTAGKAEEKYTLTELDLAREIELVKKFELGEYEVVHPVLHHYRFKLKLGNIDRISIVEISGIIDMLESLGYYKKTIRRNAEIIPFNKAS